MMDAERFYTGVTFDEFVASARKYPELWTMGQKRAMVPAAILAPLEELAKPLHLAIITEDWCIDAIGSVPYVAKLAELLPDVDVRIFGRETNPDLMNAHLFNGTRSIPVVIVYDSAWRELGWWGPRPAPLQAWVASVGATVPKDDKYHFIRQWYARDRGATSLAEICGIVRSHTPIATPATTG